MEQDSCFFNKLLQKTSHLPHCFFHTPSKEAGGGGMRNPISPRRIKLAPWLPKRPHTCRRSFVIHPGASGHKAQVLSLLPPLLIPRLMEPKRLQPPSHPSPPNLHPHPGRPEAHVALWQKQPTKSWEFLAPSGNMLELLPTKRHGCCQPSRALQLAASKLSSWAPCSSGVGRGREPEMQAEWLWSAPPLQAGKL